MGSGHLRQVKEIKKLKDRVVKLQKGTRVTEIQLEIQKCKDEVEKLLNAEEVMWKQRGKMQWIKEGDKSSRFFHLRSSTRKQHQLQKMKNNEGQWKFEAEDMQDIIL
ncbi:UNVERIFIED_CONTAM: hypothetical protein Sindi_1377000 [Sesamum indicum]